MDFWIALEWFIAICEQIGHVAAFTRILLVVYLWLTVAEFFGVILYILILNLDALKKSRRYKGNKIVY